jgi:hypothetical protein
MLGDTVSGMTNYLNTDIPTRDEIDAMSDRELRTLEARCRRAAQRQGLRLDKSRRRDPRAVDYGTYWLVDAETTGVVEGGSNFGIGLDEVADFLWGERGDWWRNGGDE